MAYILSPKNHSGWEFTIWFLVLVFGLWGLHRLWLRRFLDVHALVLSAEGLKEGGVYAAIEYSEFFHNNTGYVVRLIPAKESDEGFEERFFYTVRDYHVDGCGQDVLQQINMGNKPLVTVRNRKLILLV